MSLADKLHNLRDLATSCPPSWDLERTQLYFTWSAQVCLCLPLLPPSVEPQVLSGLRGTNEALEAELEQLLNKRGVSMVNPDPDTSCLPWKQYGS